MKTKTINICGKAVELTYDNGTEKGYEEIRGKSITEFDFNSFSDGFAMAMACIISAADIKGEEPAVTTKELLHDASSEDTQELFTAMFTLRNEFYHVPEKLAAKLKAEQEAAKENGELEEEVEDPNA